MRERVARAGRRRAARARAHDRHVPRARAADPEARSARRSACRAGSRSTTRSDQLGAVREAMRVDPRRRPPLRREGDPRRGSRSRRTRSSRPTSTRATRPTTTTRSPPHVYPKYQEALRACAAFDFDDLIVEPVRLWQRDADGARERWAERFRYVMVDEFQDTNRAQLRMVQAARSRDHGNLCVVGDDDQSIYSWRGADPTNILEFDELFPGAKIVKLEQNYRSTKSILAAANAVIANNKQRHGKTLWSQLGDGELDHARGRARPPRTRRSGSRARSARSHEGRPALERRRDPVSLEHPGEGARGGAAHARGAVRDVRRPAVLRAQGGQGRHRVPARRAQPARRARAAPRDQLSGARHRRDDGREARRRGARRSTRRCGTRCASVTGGSTGDAATTTTAIRRELSNRDARRSALELSRGRRARGDRRRRRRGDEAR